MLLDKNGTLECTSYLALRSVIVILMIVVVMSLLLHADEHFGEEIALQFLPILAVFAHVNFTVETQLSEPMNVSVKSKQKIPPPPRAAGTSVPLEVEAVPIVHTRPQFLCYLIQILLQFVLHGTRRRRLRRPGWTVYILLRLRGGRLCLTQILRIWTPAALWNFNGNKARKRLLLSGSVEGGELASNSHDGSWNRVLRGA